MVRKDDMDADMRELMEVMGRAVVPRCRRRAVYRTNLHAPYYSRSRYTKI